MKKLAIGCGIALLVVGIAGAAVAWYVYRSVSSTVSQFAELGQMPDLERDVRNTSTFTPPASEELTDAQIEKLLQVQGAVRERIGQRIGEFETKYKALADKKEANVTDLPAIMRAYRDMASTWMDAKRAQVDALNKTGLSLAEYRWVRDQAYRAIGMAYVDLDVSKFVEDARRGTTSSAAGDLRGSVEPTGPESNRLKLEKVKKTLEQNIALASFGL
jgi:hypothetical protein